MYITICIHVNLWFFAQVQPQKGCVITQNSNAVSTTHKNKNRELFRCKELVLYDPWPLYKLPNAGIIYWDKFFRSPYEVVMM